MVFVYANRFVSRIAYCECFFGKAKRQTCIVFAILLFIFDFLVPTINSLLEIKIAFEMPLESYALFYFAIGKLMYTSDILIFNKKQIFACILNVILLILIIMDFHGCGNYLGYNSPVIAGLSISIFLLIKGIKLKVSKKMWMIDRLCFGVYLIHPLFVNFLYKGLKVTPLNFRDVYVVGVIVMWLGFTVASFFASYVMNLIKPLKKYVL